MAAATKNVTFWGTALIFPVKVTLPIALGSVVSPAQRAVELALLDWFLRWCLGWHEKSTEILVEWDVDCFHELEGCYKALERSIFFGSGTTLWFGLLQAFRFVWSAVTTSTSHPKGNVCALVQKATMQKAGCVGCIQWTSWQALRQRNWRNRGDSDLFTHLSQILTVGISSKAGTQVFLNIGMLSQSIIPWNLTTGYSGPYGGQCILCDLACTACNSKTVPWLGDPWGVELGYRVYSCELKQLQGLIQIFKFKKNTCLFTQYRCNDYTILYYIVHDEIMSCNVI